MAEFDSKPKLRPEAETPEAERITRDGPGQRAPGKARTAFNHEVFDHRTGQTLLLRRVAARGERVARGESARRRATGCLLDHPW